MRISREKKHAIIDCYKRGISIKSLTDLSGFSSATIQGVINSSLDVDLILSKRANNFSESIR